jgi:hypothetical protein
MRVRSIGVLFVASLLTSATASAATLYGFDEANGGSIHTINQINGTTSLVGPVGLAPNNGGLGYDYANGKMYLSDAQPDITYDLATINLATGAGTVVGDQLSNNILDVAYDSGDQILYGIAAALDPPNLVTMNEVTGARTTVVGSMGVSGIVDMSYDNVNDTLYATTATGLYTVNILTGAATLVGTYTSVTDMAAVAYDPDTNTLYGGTGGGILYTINIATGAETLVGSTGLIISGLEFVSATPPAPSGVPVFGWQGMLTVALMLMVMGVVTGRGRI